MHEGWSWGLAWQEGSGDQGLRPAVEWGSLPRNRLYLWFIGWCFIGVVTEKHEPNFAVLFFRAFVLLVRRGTHFASYIFWLSLLKAGT